MSLQVIHGNGQQTIYITKPAMQQAISYIATMYVAVVQLLNSDLQPIVIILLFLLIGTHSAVPIICDRACYAREHKLYLVI